MANLVERLLKADVKNATELKTGTFKSQALARVLGETEPVEIKIQEVSARKQNSIMDTALDDKGNVDLEKAYDANLKLIIAGVVEPSMKDDSLKEHFGCKMAIDLAEMLFKNEAGAIAEAIINLGKVGEVADDEETIKN